MVDKMNIKKSKVLLTAFFALIAIAYITTFSITYSEYTTTTTLSDVENNTGIFDNVVVLDDFVADYNYYMGLNYTDSFDGVLPDGSNQNIYNDTNLVMTTIHYSGSAIDNDDLVGYVSLSERQNVYTYYKYYPVVDGYINIELIDNPFSDRPDDMGFNGWLTDYSGVSILFDDVHYVRYAKVPVEVVDEKPVPIEITFNAIWYEANVGYINSTNNSWDNVFDYFEERGLKIVGEIVSVYEDVSDFYVGYSLSRNQRYPAGALNNRGQSVSGTCRSYSCSYFLLSEDSVYNPNLVYYMLNGNGNNKTMREYEVKVIGERPENYLEEGSLLAGFYREVIIPRNGSLAGYYNGDGVLQEGGTCTINGGCQYYELIQYYDSEGNVNRADGVTSYYYFVSRDMNIAVVSADISSTWSSDQKYPFTLTSLHNGVDSSSSVTWDVSNIAVNCYDDIRIEYIKIATTQGNSTSSPTGSSGQRRYFYGNYHNVKIGRGILKNNNYKNFNGLFGGDNNSATLGSANDVVRYKLIVESGFYNTITLTNGAGTTNRNKYIEGVGQYGNDYDRANFNDDNLDVYYVAAGSWGNGNYYASTNAGITFDTTIKSGRFGSEKSDDHTVGIYVGGRSYGTHYTSRKIKIEGGWTYNVIGGPLTASNRSDVNDTYIFMTGGEVDMIIGGAGTSATYGNRIISLTGGVVNYSVFGGSNGYDGSSSDGTLNGSSFLYVGGNSIVGSSVNVSNNNTLWGVEAGSVFGIGNGKSGIDTIGSNDNSNIVIDGNAIVLNNVYGGGNYGATGISSTSNYNVTNINLLGGTVNGSVYGGGNNNGAGSASKLSTININMTAGTVVGSIYGGSRTRGTVYGNVNLNVSGGHIHTSVYGGGEGGYTSSSNPGTFVTGSINVNIGEINSANDNLKIYDSVYGGSAFGTVNGNTMDTSISSYNTYVTVNSGIIENVYGGGEGNDIYTPYVKGDVVVDINGGNITNVFGGNDLKGTPNGKIIVNVNGGEIYNAYAGGNQTEVEEPYINLLGGSVTNAFGGGNQAKVNVSNVLLDGGNVFNIFGGSNASGDVTISNVIAETGVATNIFGGNNIGGTTATTNVTINGGDIENVYGGGEKTDVTESSNVILNAKAFNVFGGSDSAGVVNVSYISINDGIATNVYGGNNLGGTTTTANIRINGGVLKNVYGGGLKAYTTATNINMIYGNVFNIFGGGSQAGVGVTHVNLNKGYIQNTFGGSNTNGDVEVSNIKNISSSLSESNLTVDTSFSASSINQSGISDMVSSETITVDIANQTGVNITKWDFYLYTNSSVLDSNWSGTNVEEIDGLLHADEVSQWYGTNPINNGTVYNFSFNIHSYVEYEEFKILGYTMIGYDDTGNKYQTSYFKELYNSNIFGGNNLGGQTKTSNINLTSGIVDLVYGGGEKATTELANVIIDGAVINKAVYGGGNEAPVTTDTLVEINNSNNILGDVYGGGNAGNVDGNTTVNVTSSIVFNNVYGGGNKGEVIGVANVRVNNSTVNNSIYGGGNEAAVRDDVKVEVIDSNIKFNIFGGGNNGRVLKNTATKVSNCIVGDSVYAGGNGSTATVEGNNLINIEGKTVISNHVFGGGNAAETGVEGFNNSKSEVNIAGAIINGNVYGGANTSVVNGETYVNIGINTIDSNYELVSDDINIAGTVFGGGEANASGSEEYDFEFISVTKGININIDAKNHEIYNIMGSIFGSGNASSSGGYSYININNYGTSNKYKTNVSIQRTDVVTIDNSAIELIGAKDRTNKFKEELFTLSRIKHLKLKNGATLYLNRGANLLEKYSSLEDVNGEELEVEVAIDKEKGTVTKNITNSIYMLEGKNLTISDDESLATYGIVEGMSFFGMFTKDRNGIIETAMYSPEYDYGDVIEGSELYYFSSGSYVMGQHKTEHDYKLDGFYTNYGNETGTAIVVDYINPTPNDTIYYRWVVGEAVKELEVETLVASKYSTLGTYELQLTDYYHPNTVIHVLGVNYDELSSDIELINPSDIPRHANSDGDANTNFGLGMQSGTNGWITKGETDFLTKGNKSINGTTTYKTENSTTIPNLIFYLYHSKNITESKSLGVAKISIMVVTPIDELNDKVERINIIVPMATALYDGDNYEGAITIGAKYEMFAGTNVNITSDSTFSTYYSLYLPKDTSPYKEGSYRSLISSYALPINTKITMIDFASSTNPEYYYYVVNDNDYMQSVSELNSDGEASYPLSRFIKMGSSNANNTYSDSAANISYYNDELKVAEEEFVFIVDLKDANIEVDVLKKNLLIELRDKNHSPVIPVLDVAQQKMYYNLYVGTNAYINANASLSSDTLYVGSTLDLMVITNFEQQEINKLNIIDTNYYDKKLGVKLSLYDINGELVNGATLLGTRFIYDGVNYFSRQDGTVRFNIAESVANVSSKIIIDATNSNIPTGSYKLVIEPFGSSDGIYYGLEASTSLDVDLNIVNEKFGLSANMYNSDVIIDKDTGFGGDENQYLEFQFAYSSNLNNPNIRVSLYRRTYTNIYDYTYELVDLSKYITNDLVPTVNDYEYLLKEHPEQSFQYIFNMKEDLMTGTYQVKFSLYDNNTYIGDITKYIIIE